MSLFSIQRMIQQHNPEDCHAIMLSQTSEGHNKEHPQTPKLQGNDI